MISNKKIIGGLGIGAALAVAAALYSTKDETPVAPVKTPEECTQEFAAKSREIGQKLKIEPGQSAIMLTQNPEIREAAEGLTACIAAYADSQGGIRHTP